MYSLFPEGLITYENDKELCEAAKKVIMTRGDDPTGWRPGWAANLWARLRDGNRAMEALDKSAHYEPAGKDIHEEVVECYARHANLVLGLIYAMSCHGALLSGMCEMLVQSDENSIYFLPALP